MNEVIKFGKWDGKPLEWDVIDEDKYKKLLFCRTSVRSTSNNSPWKDLYERDWLNDDFLKKAFIKAERVRIVNAKHTEKKESFKDDIFLLSKAELKYWAHKSGMGGRSTVGTTTIGRNNRPIYLDSNGDAVEKGSYDSFRIYPALYLKKNID